MPRNSPTISMVRTSASESFGAGPRWRMRRPLSRWSIRQKTATMKVLRSIRRRPPLCVRCYWANTERKEVFSLAQLFTRNLHMGLANSWETSRRAIRPCTASSVLCGLAVSISRALCSAIRWFLSMMPLVPNFLALLVLPSLKSTRDTLRGVLTTLCLKPQVIAMRQLHSYIPSPADDAPSSRPRYALRRAYRGHANFGEAATPNPGALIGLSLPRCLPLSLQGRVLDDLLCRKLRNGLWLGFLLLSSHSCSLLAYHLRSHPELLGTCRGY